VRLNLYLRGIDLIDLELHCGSKGLYVDLSVFQPRDGEQGQDDEPAERTADLSGTTSCNLERAEGPVWNDDQPAVVQAFGFGRAT